MNVTFLHDTTLKSTGQRIPAGTKAAGRFVKFTSNPVACREIDRIEVTLADGTVVTTGKMSLFFKAPSVRTMEKWNDTGIAKSVTGKRCEPDGHGDDGSPSWMLALGLI